jgi:hypothetical protein
VLDEWPDIYVGAKLELQTHDLQSGAQSGHSIDKVVGNVVPPPANDHGSDVGELSKLMSERGW